jgi:hypothetical protein
LEENYFHIETHHFKFPKKKKKEPEKKKKKKKKKKENIFNVILLTIMLEFKTETHEILET